MSKIAQIFQKRSSPDKSASLDRSTSNDTSTDPVLALKFKLTKLAKDRLEDFLRSISNDTSTSTDPISETRFKSSQEMLGALNKEYGNIQKIGTVLDKRSYSEAQSKYKILHDEIKDPTFSLEKEQKDSLLFRIYHDLAISAFLVGKFKEHKEHLLHAYNKYSPDRDKSIIGLERWVEIYKTLGPNAKDVPSISEEYDTLLKEVKEDVQALIKDKKYAEAREKIKYLNDNSHNFHIFDLYFDIIKKDLKEALKYFEDKSKNNLTQRQDIHNILKKWQIYLSNQVDDQEVAAKAATYASKYNPNPTVATAPVKKAVKKAVKEVERDKEKYDKSTLKLKTVVTVDEQEKQIKELKAKHEAEKAETAAKHKAELEKTNAEFNAKLEALKPKDSPTKDTKVGEAGDFSPTSSLLASYTTSIPLVEVAENTPTAPVVKPLEENVLKELTELANLIASLQYYDSKYAPAKDKAKKLLNEVIKENLDVYKTIEDSKILVLLADVLLSSNEMEKARIVCDKALKIDPNIWQVTNDQVVLLNLAGVLLLSFSNEPKAKEVYSKAISMRIFSEDEHGNCKIDANRTSTVSKTVAQDGYSAEERDCLAEVCLSSPKAFQIAQALNCYPHTDVAKREAIAGQFKQLAKHIPEKTPSGYKGYLLYSKAYSVLKDDQVLLQDMKAAYDTTRFATIMPTVHSYPPTEESTCYLLGMCANNDY